MALVEGIDVLPGSKAALQPGGFHVMIMQLTYGLKVGDTMPLTFHFDHAGDIKVEAKVMPLNATGLE